MVDFDVVSLPETDHLAEGERAPDFTRPLVNGEFWEDASLADVGDGGPVLLVCYPMDGAFPATYVWNEIRDRGWGRGDTDAVTVVGISVSSPYEHKTFLEERGMDYDLFSDPAAGVAADLGVEHDLDGMAGVTEFRPAVFLLDGDLTVEYAWVAEEWPDFPDYDAVEAELRALD